MINIRVFFKSLKYAGRGLRFVWQNEQNFRIQSFVGLLVLIGIFVFHVNLLEAVALIGVVALVLILELMNTIFEKISDLLKPRIHHYVHIIKDMMAAAVLIASFAAIAIGVLIFLPHILSLVF